MPTAAAVLPIRPAASPFDALTLEDARKLVTVPDYLATNRAFYEGDHWQDGRGWIGPMPGAGADGYDEALREIRKAFTPENLIADVVNRHRDGVVGRAPAWEFAPRRPMGEDGEPTGAEERELAEIHAALTEWWDAREGQAHRALRAFATTRLWGGRSCLRLYVPRGLLDPATRQVPRGTLAESLERIRIEHVAPEQGTVYEDADTGERLGVYLYESAPGQAAAELVYVRPDGRTVLRVLRSDEPDAGGEVVLELGRRLTMFEAAGAPLVSETIRAQQRALNLAMSMVPRNLITGGFLERIITNAQLSGKWADGPNGERQFRPDPLVLGAGVIAVLQGIEVPDTQGGVRRATPGVHYREPVDVEPTARGAEVHRAAILRAANQEHTRIAGDAMASGVARQIARDEYARSLAPTAEDVTNAARWMLEGALAMAEQFSGRALAYSRAYKAVPQARLYLGAVPLEDQKANAELAERGAISTETAMSRNGIEDTDAERASIAAQPDAKLNTMKKAAEVVELADRAELVTPELAVRVLVDAGWPIEDAKAYAAELVERRTPRPGEPGSGMGSLAGVRIPGLTDDADDAA